MRKYLILTIVFLLPIVYSFAAQDSNEAAPEGGTNWFELFITIGYLAGVFILLPIVIYTNFKEKLFVPDPADQDKIQPLQNLSVDERNSKAALILESIEKKLTSYQNEDGENMVTITSGKQAKYMRRGLDYINKRLSPTDENIIGRVEEFTKVYQDRTRRVFAGSKWIIACAVIIGLIFLYTDGIGNFIVLHFLGLAFYVLSSRISIYTLEKRLERFGKFGGGTFGSIFMGLFAAANAKHYYTSGQGKRMRDHSSEFTGGAVYFLIIVIFALILGFAAALLGVINFIFNYSTALILPWETVDEWYAKNFELTAE